MYLECLRVALSAIPTLLLCSVCKFQANATKICSYQVKTQNSTETNFIIIILTFYVNYANGSIIIAKTITRCTYVRSCILPLYINQMQVTRGIELACWDAIFCPGDVWMWITRCIAFQCIVLTKIKLNLTDGGNSYFWRLQEINTYMDACQEVETS